MMTVNGILSIRTSLLATAFVMFGAMGISAFAQDSADSRGTVLQLLRRARVAVQTGDEAGGTKLIQAALAFSSKADDPLVEGWARQLAGEMAFGKSDQKAAMQEFTAALEAFKRAKETSGAAASQVNLGRLLLGDGKPAEALVHFQAAHEAYSRIGRSKEMAGVLADLGATQRVLKQPEAAIASLTKALELYGEDVQTAPSRLEAMLNLGSCLLDQGKAEEAKKPLMDAIALAKKSGDKSSEADAHAALGAVMQRTGMGEAALTEYKAALSADGKSDPVREADIHNNLGALAQEQGRLDEAKAEFTKALELYSHAKNESGSARAFCNLAIVHESEGKVDEAIAVYEKALSLRKEMNDSAGSAKVLDNLASLAASQGESAKARQFQLEAEQLRKK